MTAVDETNMQENIWEQKVKEMYKKQNIETLEDKCKVLSYEKLARWSPIGNRQVHEATELEMQWEAEDGKKGSEKFENLSRDQITEFTEVYMRMLSNELQQDIMWWFVGEAGNKHTVEALVKDVFDYEIKCEDCNEYGTVKALSLDKAYDIVSKKYLIELGFSKFCAASLKVTNPLTAEQ